MSKTVKIEKVKPEGMPSGEYQGDYPYGTRLEFEGDMVEELELDKLSAGDTVSIRATATVKRKTEKVDQDGDEEDVEKEVTLQLTSVAVAKSNTDKVKALYGEDD